MARSRSGTRGRRGPRKPQRRTGGFTPGAVSVVDPSERGPIELPPTDHRQGSRGPARRQPGGHHPGADQERDLRDHQPAHRPGYRVARRERARLRGRRGRGRGRRRDGGRGGHRPRAGGHEGGPVRGGRPRRPRRPRPDRDRHGPRRPRQDQPARRDPIDHGRLRRAWRHHPAHRRLRGHHQGWQADRVPRHSGSRGVHLDARPRRAGHRHRGDRGGRGRRRHAPDAGGDQPRQGGQGAAGHRDEQDRPGGGEPRPREDRAGRGRRGRSRTSAATRRWSPCPPRPRSASTRCSR